MSESFQNERSRSAELLYTTVFSQVFSPCHKFLAVGNNFGRISLFSLSAALSPSANGSSKKPMFTFKANDGPVYSMVSTERFLISAGTENINGWSWSELLKKTPKLSWSLSIPANVHHQVVSPETNSLAICTVDGVERIYAGCGDNMIHSWDLSTGSFLHSYSGHSDYIHSVCVRQSTSQFLSASEDGSVRLWDVRSKTGSLEVIEPFKNQECARPNIGKWIGCLAVDEKSDDWMVCGGGPSLSLWHLRSLSPTAIFPTPNVYINHVMFYEDMLISGGSEPYIQQWSINGERRAHVPCTPTNIFSIAINHKSDNLKVLSAAGNSEKLDICTNFGYRAFSLELS